MADKSPRKSNGKKPGKTLKEKRAAKKDRRSGSSGLFETLDQPPVTRPPRRDGGAP